MARPTFLQFAVTVLLLAGTLAVSSLSAHRVTDALALPLDRIPSRIRNWEAERDNTLDAPTLRALKPTSYLARDYVKGNRHLNLFIAYYAQQRAGESMHSPKHCLPGAGWEIWKTGSTSIPFEGRSVAINEYSIQNEGVRRLMFYWYQSNSRIIASEYLGKLFLARDAVLTGRTAGSIVRITLPELPDSHQEGLAFSVQLAREVALCLGGSPSTPLIGPQP